LGHLDDRHAAQDTSRITALIPRAAPAFDETSGFIVVDRGDGYAAARGHLTDAELHGIGAGERFLHERHPLDLKWT
jgi:hypothetical protein